MSQLALTNYPLGDVERMAHVLLKSGCGGIKSPEQAMVLMLLCQAEGLHPITALNEYHLVGGRPSLKAETMLARFQRAGGTVNWIETTDKAAEAEFSHPVGGTLRFRYTVEMARRAELMNLPNWKKHPESMLCSRVVSFSVRRVYPACLSGMKAQDEVEEIMMIERQEARPMELSKQIESQHPDPQFECTDQPSDPVIVEVPIEVLPPIDVPPAHPLDAAFQGRDILSIEAFLISKKELQEGQSYRDLSPQFTQFVLQFSDRFFTAVENHAANTTK